MLDTKTIKQAEKEEGQLLAKHLVSGCAGVLGRVEETTPLR